jgi:dipeptidyl aminopeptidase/acylaminoacyl peptidase
MQLRAHILAATTCCLAMTLAAQAEVPTPARPVSDPHAILSPANPAAHPVPVEDLAFSRGLLSAAWSADGRRIFVSTNLTGRYNLWRTDAAGSWPVQLTQSDDRQGGIAVSPDGRTVYFQQDKGGNEQFQIYAVPASGGAVTDLSNAPDMREGDVLVSPDGHLLAITLKAKDKGQTDLAVMDAATHRLRNLTNEADPQWNWGPVAWVDQGRALIANRGFTDGTAGEVWRIDIASGRTTRLLGKAKTVYSAAGATTDGNRLSVTTNDGTGQMHAGIYTVAGGAWRWLKPTPWEQSGGPISPDGRWMMASTSEDGRTRMTLVSVATMAERTLPMPPGDNGLASDHPFSPDSRELLVLQSGADSPTNLAILDLATGHTRPATALAMASLLPEGLPKSRVVTWRSFDGTLVSGILTIPFNAKRDGSNPAVVMPHGGPTGQSQDYFNKTATALASRGYFVIRPNVRGSTGYGHAFQVANYQDLGGGDLKDELAAKDFLVATGYVDAKRVGITGGSYGGFMTLMAIGRAPDAFAAAVQMYGIINWRTMWEHEDAGLRSYQRSLLGSPEEFPKVYDAASPLTYIREAKAPLLSLQGENDIRVPRGQAQEVADILKAKGNVVETVFYPAEGHGFAKRENQTDALRRTVEWFDRYLKPAR